jgi:hypothetical protein
MAKRKKLKKEKKEKKSGSSHVTVDSSVSRDKLVDLLANSLNKSSDSGKIAFTLDVGDDPSQISDWVSTGVTELDIAISNQKDGGFPCGRIVELTGLEGCVTEDTEIDIIIE